MLMYKSGYKGTHTWPTTATPLVSKVLSLALEPISKSAVHYLSKKVSSVKIAKEPRYRMCIVVDEVKLSLEASYGRSCVNALAFLKKH